MEYPEDLPGQSQLPPPPTIPPNPFDDEGHDDGGRKEKESDWHSLIQMIIAFFLYLSMFVIGLRNTGRGGEEWWVVSLTAIACHIYLSIVVINERQLGAMFILGRAIRDIESGPHFAFWPFCYVRRETKNMIQIEIGVLTDEEKKKAKELESSASLYLLEDPLYVNWGDLESANATLEERKMFKGNPYGDSMVTDTHVTVRFRISSLSKLIRKAGSLTEGIELVQKVVTSTLVSHAGKSFVGRVIRDMESMDEELKKSVEEFVVDPNSEAYSGTIDKPGRPEDSWGVDVEKTQITRLGTSKRINVAIAEKGKIIYEAQAQRVKTREAGFGEAEAMERKAAARRIELAQEGAGKAEAEKLLLFARQEGIKKLAKIAGTPAGQLILQLEALERGLKEGKSVILPMELSRIVGALSERLIPPSSAALK
jgi:regulator of protease activity HflC (stomatin/prohibitin superfamily)